MMFNIIVSALVILGTVQATRFTKACANTKQLCGETRCIQFAIGEDGCPVCECVQNADRLGDMRLESNTRLALEVLMGITNLNDKGTKTMTDSSKELEIGVWKWDNILENHRWVIPFRVNDSLDTATWSTIRKAIFQFERRVCLKFIRRTNQKYFLDFSDDGKGGCWSYVGRRMSGKPNVINLSAGCNDIGIVMQEMMHALGFFHEHQRPDRDDHVKVIWENIQPGLEANFYRMTSSSLDSNGDEYDARSIMHYRDTAFSKDQISKTMMALDRRRLQTAGGSRLTGGDVSKLVKAYRCGIAPPTERNTTTSKIEATSTPTSSTATHVLQTSSITPDSTATASKTKLETTSTNVASTSTSLTSENNSVTGTNINILTQTGKGEKVETKTAYTQPSQYSTTISSPTTENVATIQYTTSRVKAEFTNPPTIQTTSEAALSTPAKVTQSRVIDQKETTRTTDSISLSTAKLQTSELATNPTITDKQIASTNVTARVGIKKEISTGPVDNMLISTEEPATYETTPTVSLSIPNTGTARMIETSAAKEAVSTENYRENSTVKSTATPSTPATTTTARVVEPSPYKEVVSTANSRDISTEQSALKPTDTTTSSMVTSTSFQPIMQETTPSIPTTTLSTPTTTTVRVVETTKEQESDSTTRTTTLRIVSTTSSDPTTQETTSSITTTALYTPTTSTVRLAERSSTMEAVSTANSAEISTAESALNATEYNQESESTTSSIVRETTTEVTTSTNEIPATELNGVSTRVIEATSKYDKPSEANTFVPAYTATTESGIDSFLVTTNMAPLQTRLSTTEQPEICQNEISTCVKRRRAGLCHKKPYKSKKVCDKGCRMCGCDDKSTGCRMAGGLGFCQDADVRNVEIMANTCPLTCKLCGESCVDRRRKCFTSFARGECESNYREMLTSCPNSCGFCVTGRVKPRSIFSSQDIFEVPEARLNGLSLYEFLNNRD